jgi:hypothetical protein
VPARGPPGSQPCDRTALVVVAMEAPVLCAVRPAYNPDMSSGDASGMPFRAASRRTWPVRLVALGAEPRDHLDRSTTPEERLAMVWSLTVEAWALCGRPMPAYPRTATPVRLCGLDRRRPETPA